MKFRRFQKSHVRSRSPVLVRLYVVDVSDRAILLVSVMGNEVSSHMACGRFLYIWEWMATPSYVSGYNFELPIGLLFRMLDIWS